MYFLIFLLIAHFYADFKLQSREMALRKSKDVVCLLQHGLIIFTATLFMSLVLTKFNILKVLAPTFLYATTHMLQDWFVWRWYKWKRSVKQNPNFKYWEDPLFYSTIGFDVTLHVCLVIVCYQELIFNQVK